MHLKAYAVKGLGPWRLAVRDVLGCYKNVHDIGNIWVFEPRTDVGRLSLPLTIIV
jgi:hypothetical protein